MTLLALGINHKTAPVALREKVAFTPDSLVAALASLKSVEGVNESVIVSTCNRTELYVNTQDDTGEKILRWLSDFHHLDEQEIAKNSYLLAQDDAVKHIMRVAISATFSSCAVRFTACCGPFGAVLQALKNTPVRRITVMTRSIM